VNDEEKKKLSNSLLDAGCDQKTVEAFMALRQESKIEESLLLLSRYRKELLKCVRENQEKNRLP
jgi:hypothetical protein